MGKQGWSPPSSFLPDSTFQAPKGWDGQPLGWKISGHSAFQAGCALAAASRAHEMISGGLERTR